MSGHGRLRSVWFVLVLAPCWANLPVRAMGEQQGNDHAPRTPSDRGVRVLARVDREEVTTVESVELTVEVRGNAGNTDTRLDPEPVVGGELGGFTVAWVRRDQAVVDEGEVVQRWVIGLEPFLAGEARIPPIGVATGDVSTEEGVVRSQEIVVRVRSMLEGASGFEAGRARAPLEPAPSVSGEPGVAGWVWGAIGGACATLAASGVVAARRKGRPERQARRAWRGIRQQAAAASAGRGVGGAEAGVSALRGAAALALGERAGAMSSEELVQWLREAAPVGDDRHLGALLHWADARTYGGAMVEPPPVPDLVRVIDAIEGWAAHSRGQGARR